MLKSHWIITLLLAVMVSLSGCDSGQQAEDKATPTLQLNANNIDSFTERMAKNYLNIQTPLLKAFASAQKNDNAQEFIQYRNTEWTDLYIVEKNRYADIYASNKHIINGHPSANLFMLYEDLIYIGLDLKNGLLENDSARQKRALKAAAEATSTATQLAKIPAKKQPKESGAGLMILN